MLATRGTVGGQDVSSRAITPVSGVLSPKSYSMAKEWCCGLICCFNYACGIGGNNCQYCICDCCKTLFCC